MRVHNALAIATTDRLAQVQAKNAADAARRVQDLYSAASRLKADAFELGKQTSEDPDSERIAQKWSEKPMQASASHAAEFDAQAQSSADVSSMTGPSATASVNSAPRGISFWA